MKYHEKKAAVSHEAMRHEHHIAAFHHELISKQLKRIVKYHRNRTKEIKKGDAPVDHDEAKKIEASTTFSAEAHRCADMHPLAMGPALTRLSKIHLLWDLH